MDWNPSVLVCRAGGRGDRIEGKQPGGKARELAEKGNAMLHTSKSTSPPESVRHQVFCFPLHKIICPLKFTLNMVHAGLFFGERMEGR